MKKLLASLAIIAMLASANTVLAAEVCGVEIADLSEERVTRPGDLDTHLGSITEIALSPNICQGVQLGPIRTSFDGFKEILVTLVANDNGDKRMSTDLVAFQRGNSNYPPFFSVRGHCHWMKISLLPEGKLGSTCDPSDTFVATLSGMDGP